MQPIWANQAICFDGVESAFGPRSRLGETFFRDSKVDAFEVRTSPFPNDDFHDLSLSGRVRSSVSVTDFGSDLGQAASILFMICFIKAYAGLKADVARGRRPTACLRRDNRVRRRQGRREPDA